MADPFFLFVVPELWKAKFPPPPPAVPVPLLEVLEVLDDVLAAKSLVLLSTGSFALSAAAAAANMESTLTFLVPCGAAEVVSVAPPADSAFLAASNRADTFTDCPAG